MDSSLSSVPCSTQKGVSSPSRAPAPSSCLFLEPSWRGCTCLSPSSHVRRVGASQGPRSSPQTLSSRRRPPARPASWTQRPTLRSGWPCSADRRPLPSGWPAWPAGGRAESPGRRPDGAAPAWPRRTNPAAASLTAAARARRQTPHRQSRRRARSSRSRAARQPDHNSHDPARAPGHCGKLGLRRPAARRTNPFRATDRELRRWLGDKWKGRCVSHWAERSVL